MLLLTATTVGLPRQGEGQVSPLGAELVVEPSQHGYVAGEIVTSSLWLRGHDLGAIFPGSVSYQTAYLPLNDTIFDLDGSEVSPAINEIDWLFTPNGTKYQITYMGEGGQAVTVDAGAVDLISSNADFGLHVWTVAPGATCQLRDASDRAGWHQALPNNQSAPAGPYLVVTRLEDRSANMTHIAWSPFSLGTRITRDEPGLVPSDLGCEYVTEDEVFGSFGTDGADGYEFLNRPRWAATAFPVTWRHNLDNIPLGADATRDQLIAGFNTWENDAGSYMDFTYGGTSVAGPWNFADGLNVIAWGDLGPGYAGTLALADCHVPDELIVECGMRFNTVHDWDISGAPLPLEYDVQTVAVHEIGHWLELGHVCEGYAQNPTNCYGADLTAVMRDGVDSGATNRNLGWGDKAGARYIYPNRYNSRSDTGTSTEDNGVESAQLNAGTAPDLVYAWADASSGTQQLKYGIAWDLSAASGQQLICCSGPTLIADLPGDSDGVGVAQGFIDGDSLPDFVFAWIDNNFASNDIYYYVGWDAGANGQPASWSARKDAIGGDGVGSSNDGLGACITNLNADSRRDLVLAWVVDELGENNIRYVVGSDMTSTGSVSSWGPVKTANPGAWVGWDTRGVGLACMNIDELGGPDLIVSWVDAPDGPNKVWYWVGFNPDADGDILTWTSQLQAPGTRLQPIPDETQGLGVAAPTLDAAGTPELAFAYVVDLAGQNEIRYMVEWNGRWTQHS